MIINMLHPPNDYNPRRGSGRTTGIALELLGAAIRNPGTALHRLDHHAGESGQQALLVVVRSIRDRLGLRHVHVQPLGGDDQYAVKVTFNPFQEVIYA